MLERKGVHTKDKLGLIFPSPLDFSEATANLSFLRVDLRGNATFLDIT